MYTQIVLWRDLSLKNMAILRSLGILFLVILTSFYFFPFDLVFLPGVNTKMVMAGLGLIAITSHLAINRDSLINSGIFSLSLWAGFVSIIGWISVVYNGTPDLAYANYIVSMWVWLSAAYFLVMCMRFVHRCVTIHLIIRYLLVVCVIQCLLALLIDNVPIIRTFAIFVMGPQEWIEGVNRLYGIGAALDTAGVRFSVVLVLTAFYIVIISKTELRKWMPVYLIAFFIIGIIGNMIARTTTVGLILSFVYWFYVAYSSKFHINNDNRAFWVWGTFIFTVTLIITIYLYNCDPEIRKNLRFAFEGFFSLIEDGEWNVSSNEKLQTMYVFPQNYKTWLIGDGYFSNPISIDPYFIGKEVSGYYMGTDVGYLRFIFYFGLFGLLGMCMVIIKAGLLCVYKFPTYKLLFIFLIIINFLVWLKVSTDIFLIFALFLMIDSNDEENYQKHIML